MELIFRNFLIVLFLSISSFCQAGAVYWDTSHGVYGQYEPSRKYLPLVNDLAGNGLTVDTKTNGVLIDDPSGYDMIVVSVLSSYYSQYSLAEVNAIKNFVNSGGGLLIIGDNTNCPNQNVQPLASEFGISLGVSFVKPNDQYISDLSPHTIFDGVDQIYMRAAGEISSAGLLTEIARSNALTLVAAGEYGSGRVVVFGDGNFIENNYYDQADNQLFAMNTFNYLVPEPATILLFAVSGLYVSRKRRL